MPKTDGEKSNNTETNDAPKEDHQQKTDTRVVERTSGGHHRSKWERWRRDTSQEKRDACVRRHLSLQKFETAVAHQLVKAFLSALPGNQIEQKDTSRRAGRSGRNVQGDASVMSNR